MKKRSIGLLIVYGIILVIVLLIGYFVYETNYKKTEISTYRNNEYELVIYQIGTSIFPFGPSECRLVLNKDNTQIDAISFYLHNDGKRPFEENFDVYWKKENVEVIASGEEQDDITYVLYFDSDKLITLNEPQEFKANLIDWNEDSFEVIINNPMDNTIFPNGAKLTVMFDENTYFIDLDESITKYNSNRTIFEPKIGNKLKWVEGMVIQIEFIAYKEYNEGNGFYNLALGRRIENVDVIAVDVDGG